MADTTARPHSLSAAAASDVGRRRGNNEDRFHCDPERGIFMVIDGVGGHAAGERAAETALRMLRARLERETGNPAERLREAITLANNEVNRLGSADPALNGMACVLTAAIVADGRLTAGHVGDTRLYTFGHGVARKLTHDHSPVGEREDRGELDEFEAMRHPRRNEIFRDVGSLPHNPNDEEFIEILDLPFGPESAFLLCTDGLSDLVPAARIAGIVYAHADDPAAAVQKLVDAANEAGGKDNVTAVLVTGEAFARSASPYRHLGGGPAGGGGWRQRVLPPLLLAGGVLLGLALAYGAFAWLDPVRDWVMAEVRPASWPRTWRVGAEPMDDFVSIGEALQRAAPGDTVEVGPGSYPEELLIDRDVRLVSRNPREARLTPADAAPQPWVAVRVLNSSKAARITGFTIAGEPARPLAVGITVGDAAVQIDDVEITGARVAGLVLQAGSRVTLQGSHVHNNPGPGIVVEARALPRFLHNVVAANGKGGAKARPGIEVLDGATVHMFGNIVAGNGLGEITGVAASARAEWQRDNIIGLPAVAPARPRPGGKVPAVRPPGQGAEK